MKRKNKTQKGITIVALIITIIVLLILSTVAIREVNGDGIIFQAKKAANDYQEVQDEEQAKQLRISYEMARSRGYKGTFGAYLDTREYESNKGESATYNDYIQKKYTITEGKNTSNYGKRVIGFKSKGTGLDTLIWRVFYEDNNNVYLISETSNHDYPVKELTFYNTSSGNVYTPTDILSKYTSGADVSAQGRALMPLASSLFTTSNTNINIRSTAYMTDTKLWDSYTDEDGKARWAMGAPTVELFCKAYSAYGLGNVNIDITEYGYNITSSTGGVLELEKGPNGIFKLTKDGSSSWLLLSSPFGDWYTNMCEAGGAGLILHARNSNYTSRPIVCIPRANFQYELAD